MQTTTVALQPLQKFLLQQDGPLYSKLTLQDQRYVDVYCETFNKYTAARISHAPAHIFRHDEIAAAIAERLAMLSKVSTLNAEYVREYIREVLELCPTDYFTLGPNGEWCIDPVSFRELPTSIKRLVDGVEVKIVKGEVLFKVNFLSKAAALAMAAKYTLTEHLHVKVDKTLPWEQIAGPLEREAVDVVEQRIAAMESSEGSVQAEGSVMAAIHILQQTEGDSTERLGQLQDRGPSGAQAG